MDDTGVGGEADKAVINGRCRGFPATQDASLLKESNDSYRNKSRMKSSNRLEMENHWRNGISRSWRRRTKPSGGGNRGVSSFHMM